MINFTKIEIKHLIIATIILAIVFGFNDKRPSFELVLWLSNFILNLIFAGIALLIYILGHKIIAKRYSATTEYKIWGIQQFTFWTAAKFPYKIYIGKKKIEIHYIPLGSIVALITTFLSNGLFYFAAISSYEQKEIKHRRLGLKYPNVTDFENSLIALSGPFANIFFALILKGLNFSGIFNQLIFINYVHAIYQMIPFSTLDGMKIFIGSIPLYMFGLVFIILCIYLINILTAIQTLILALIFAAILTSLFFYLAQKGNL